MKGALLHTTAVFLLLTGCLRGHAQWSPPSDSLFLEGAITTMVDSLLPGLTMQVWIGGQEFQPGDSIRFKARRPVDVQCWARCTLGQVQFEADLPMRADSIPIAIHIDSAGVALAWKGDTLTSGWQPATHGCFPAAPRAEFDALLAEAAAEPFESMRLTLCGEWLDGHCLTPQQLLRLAAVFDDEERKLNLIRRASCSDPAGIHALETVFSSQYFLEAFRKWLVERD